MARVLMVGSEAATSVWAAALAGTGHAVEQRAGLLECQERFHGEPIEVMVVEIDNADRGEAMLIVQSRSVWPDCRVIAVPRDRSYRASAIFSMGLWRPDRVLLQPVEPGVLAESVFQLCAQVPATQWIRAANLPPSCRPAATEDVVLRCDSRPQARWSLRPS